MWWHAGKQPLKTMSSSSSFPNLLPLSFSNCSFKTQFLPFLSQSQPFTPFHTIPHNNHYHNHIINIIRDKITIMRSSTTTTGNGNGVFDQNVIVMRHGDRRDNFDPTWVTTADRPWDPPLVDGGRSRAFRTGRQLRTELGFPVHRVFVSPFLRCVQTASEVVSALCSTEGSDGIDPSKVKVSIEYGLCEMLSREAIRPEVVPKDGNFSFNISELEAMLPAGTVDHTAEKIYSEMPRWEETVLGSRSRYEHIIQALADKYPSENLLLVTHGEGVGTSVSTFLKGAVVYEVNYCAYSHARRRITFEGSDSANAGSFQLLTVSDQTGIGYYTSNSLSDGV